MRWICFWILIGCLTAHITAKCQDTIECYHWHRLQTASGDDEKLMALFRLAMYYQRYGRSSRGDSTAKMALGIARARNQREQSILAYELYFKYLRSINTNADCGAEAKQMMDLAKECGDDACMARAHAATATALSMNGNVSAALNEIRDAHDAAVKVKNDRQLQVNTQLQLGDIQADNNHSQAAYKAYCEALQMAEQYKDPQLLVTVFDHLANFFYTLKDYDFALDYRYLQDSLLKAAGVPDSNQYMALHVEIARNLLHKEEEGAATEELDAIIAYAHRNAHRALTDDAFTVYRKMFLDKDDIKSLSALYKKYDWEYRRIAREDKPLFTRLQAYFSAWNGDAAAAHRYFDTAEMYMANAGSYQRANFYSRYAQFLLRAKDTDAALPKLYLAHIAAVKSNYLPFMMSASQALDSIYFLKRRPDSAYHYQALNKAYYAQWTDVKNIEALKVREEEYARRAKEAAYQAQMKEETESLQTTAILLSILVSFVLLIIFNAITVSRLVLRAASFIAFLFLFEFIDMLIEHRIEAKEHTLEGHPILSLCIKLAIAGILLFLHHLVEEKAIHYLSSHRLINIAKFAIRMPRLKAGAPRSVRK